MDQEKLLADTKARIARHMALPYAFSSIHGSGECCFENIAFCAGLLGGASDGDIAAFYDCYLERFAASDAVTGDTFTRAMIMNGLLFMGKALGRRDAAVADAFRERLSRVHAFALSGAPILYSPQEREAFRGVPAVWRDTGIVRKEHTAPRLRLPIVHDLLGYAAMYGEGGEADAMMDGVVAYILGDGYQNTVQPGYGIGVRVGKGFTKGRYYAVGWDVVISRVSPRQEWLYMLLLSPVSAARGTAWYQDNLRRYREAAAAGDDALIAGVTAPIRKTYWTSGCYLDFGRGKGERASAFAEAVGRLLN